MSYNEYVTIKGNDTIPVHYNIANIHTEFNEGINMIFYYKLFNSQTNLQHKLLQ